MSLRPMNSLVHFFSFLALISVLWVAAATVSAQPSSQITSIEELARYELELSMQSDGTPPRPGDGLDGGKPGGTATEGTPGFRCLPSCSEVDGRFLAVASGANLVTLSETTLDIQIAVPPGVASFNVGIFDGDAAAANGNWDVGSAPFTYEIFEDADRDGSSSVSVAGPFASSAMLNNAWFDIAVSVGGGAVAPSGVAFYRLSVASQDPAATVLNSFKVRTDGVASVEVQQQPFGFYAALQSQADAMIVFPDFPTYDPNALPGTAGASNYDGEFNFYLDIAMAEDDLVVWGGDLDFGAWDGSTRDTDDPDTPNAPFLPPWATIDAVPETVSTGLNGSSGNPPDDVNPAGLGVYLQRSPSINFQIIDPDGAVYSNQNPSGNQEWEQFRITTGPFDPSTADFPAASLPAGQWVVRARGVDMQNLNFWRFFHPVLCNEPDGSPCTPLRPYLLGDTVFEDIDGDGVQDGGEMGISGVVVELLNALGDKIGETVTDSSGNYSFGITAEQYTVRVAAVNFLPGGSLEGLTSTTGDELTRTVVDANVFTYDFGYQPPAEAVRPVLECVSDNGDGTYTAFFGYLNPNAFEVSVPVGLSNKFTPAPQDRGQPTMFKSGRTPFWPNAAFSVVFDGGNLVWTLDGRTSTASSGSTPCSYHVFFDKLWLDEGGTPLAGPPAELGPDFRIVATSDLGSAVCSYPSGSSTLDCQYDNQRPPALDDNGLWVPAGSTYTVVEEGLPLGYEVVDGTGTYDALNGYCVYGRDGQAKFCTHTVVNQDAGRYCPPDLDFDTDADGAPLAAGTLVFEQWADLGIHVTSSNPSQHPPMIFDSANPTGGDPDLGTPNQDFGGPGVGSGGGAGTPGENSLPLGKVLILSEDRDSGDPDDNAGGGRLIFTFDVEVDVASVSLLDVEEHRAGTVRAFDGAGLLLAEVPMRELGDNSFQELSIGATGVRRLEVKFPGSGGLAGISFCGSQLSETCFGTLDFSVDGGGAPLSAGQIVDDEFAAMGMQVLTGDPANHPVMVFDTANPTGGDWDLGTPNQDFGGPGIGSGGSSGAPGQNDTALGHALILSEDQDSGDPDDNGGGGVFIFLFDGPVEVVSVRVLDVDGGEDDGAVTAFDGAGMPLASVSLAPLGDNSVQQALLDATGVRRLEVSLEGSGALAEIVSCPPGDDDDDDDDDDDPTGGLSGPPATERMRQGG